MRLATLKNKKNRTLFHTAWWFKPPPPCCNPLNSSSNVIFRIGKMVIQNALEKCSSRSAPKQQSLWNTAIQAHQFPHPQGKYSWRIQQKTGRIQQKTRWMVHVDFVHGTRKGVTPQQCIYMYLLCSTLGFLGITYPYIRTIEGLYRDFP